MCKSKLISTKLNKKKNIEKTYTWLLYQLNGQLYKQTDGVSMGSPLDPTLAKIIMTEYEALYNCKSTH